MATLKELRDERLRKLEELKHLGVDPYPAKAHRTHKTQAVHKDFANLEGKEVTVAGRITSIRKFGKIAFVVIKDDSGTLQLLWRHGSDSTHVNGTTAATTTAPAADRANSELLLADIALLDAGDFVEATGTVTKTQTGEESVEITKLRLLSKSLRPLPTAREGFTNKEERLRRRYVDINVNQDVYQRFLRRSRFWQARREFMINEGFVELNTPVLELTTGGADANPFVTHMDALGQDFYLRISHELPLKRLLVAGYEKIFDIGPRFRNENYSDEHLPEHNAMEWYWAYADWEMGMELTERLTRYTADKTWGRREFTLPNGQTIDLGPDGQHWPRISFVEVIRQHYGLDVFTCTLEEVKEQLKKHDLQVEQSENRSRGLDKLWKKVRTTIAGPAFLVDIPTFLQPLAKTQPGRPELTEQFNSLLGGSELCKAYSELNDPLDQLNRFKEQQAMRDAGDDEAMMLDIDYVEALEYAMPPACGWGDSERLFWYLEGVTAREGVIFPQLRREIDEVTKTIYPELKLGAASSQAGRSRRNTVQPSPDLPPENEYQLAVILNKTVPVGRLLNAATHAVSGFVGTLPNPQQLNYLEYHDQTGEFDAIISHHPTIILRASDSKELLKAYRRAGQAHLSNNAFIETMTLGPSLEEINIVKGKNIEELDFWGVVLFGKTADVQRVTKGYQLFGSGSESVSGDADSQAEGNVDSQTVDPGQDLPLSAAEQGTNKRYLDDYSLLECEATIQSVEAVIEDEESGKGTCRLVLDQTCLYPGGGGQACDLGEISWPSGKLTLTEVTKDQDGVVYHDGTLEGELPVPGTTVTCRVDAERRSLNSRLHCAGHLIDYAIERLGMDWKAGKGAHYPGRCYVEYSGELLPGQAEELPTKIETILADYTARGGAIRPSRVPSSDAAQHSSYLPEAILKAYQNVHITQYPDSFAVCCGGTHLTDVSQLGRVTITKIKKKNGAIRVSYEVTG